MAHPVPHQVHHLPHLVAQLGNTGESLNCRLHCIHLLWEVRDQEIVLTLLKQINTITKKFSTKPPVAHIGHQRSPDLPWGTTWCYWQRCSVPPNLCRSDWKKKNILSWWTNLCKCWLPRFLCRLFRRQTSHVEPQLLPAPPGALHLWEGGQGLHVAGVPGQPRARPRQGQTPQLPDPLCRGRGVSGGSRPAGQPLHTIHHQTRQHANLTRYGNTAILDTAIALISKLESSYKRCRKQANNKYGMFEFRKTLNVISFNLIQGNFTQEIKIF